MAVNIDFDKNKLVPAIIQDAITGKVLMLGYMNREAFDKTLDEGIVTFFSRSKNRLWTKGETSGFKLKVAEAIADCDGDTILLRVNPTGPVCHNGTDTCFNESNDEWTLKNLEQTIVDRKVNEKNESYTSELFRSGINKIAQKVGEEAVEVVIEAKDNNKQLFVDEVADLVFHLMVLLAAKDVTLDEVTQALKNRTGVKKHFSP